MQKESVSLSQLISDIKLTLQNRYNTPLWTVAEINELNINRTGHCYLELIEKDPVTDRIIAKTRATIWAYTFRTIKAYFETTTGETLRAGLKVLISVTVEFHEVYGFSLNVVEIDPQYTLGDMARRRAEIIKKLEEDGVIDMNKSINFPLVPQRIAIISSETAAGYGDFMNQLQNNDYGYDFHTELFQSLMQGDNAPESIINSLNIIADRIDEFDIVAILRGGGSKSDLSCFDNYDLAYFITQFPLPVITGIGHERDDSVTDIVAHTKLKTPTAIAEFLIDTVSSFDQMLDNYYDNINEIITQWFDDNEYLLEKLTFRLQTGARELLQNKHEYIIKSQSRVSSSAKAYIEKLTRQTEAYSTKIKIVSKNAVNREIQMCDMRELRLKKWVKEYFEREHRRLDFLIQKTDLIDPQHILNKGYSIVTKGKDVITDKKQLNKGDSINIRLAKGEVKGKVKN